MRKIILVSTFIGLSLLTFGQTKWEYKKVVIDPNAQSYPELDIVKMRPNEFEISESTLNLYGSDGWELIDVITTVETIHPNFGKGEYVTGLQPNVRTKEIILFFKRSIKVQTIKK